MATPGIQTRPSHSPLRVWNEAFERGLDQGHREAATLFRAWWMAAGFTLGILTASVARLLY